jgi:nucleoid-associated protein YgaU
MIIKQKIILMGVVTCAFMTAGHLFANPVPNGYSPAEPVYQGEQYSQNGALSAIPPSGIRRLRFYSDKAIKVLFELAKQNGNATMSVETTQGLNATIESMIEVGAKSELSVDQVAMFFAQEVEARFSGPLELTFDTPDGKLDPQMLFRRVWAAKGDAPQTMVDDKYMAILTAVNTRMATVLEAGPMPAAAPAQPQSRIYTRAEQAIIDRAEVVDGVRTIRVQSGDFLMKYAQAFYGNREMYLSIYLANPDVLRNPNLIAVGQVLVIPDQ